MSSGRSAGLELSIEEISADEPERIDEFYAVYERCDVNDDGRLPGASLTTVLAPGIGIRVGFAGSPFSLTPMVVFRPALRAWNSDVSPTGASVVQLGLLFSVDVTLFELAGSAISAHEPKVEKQAPNGCPGRGSAKTPYSFCAISPRGRIWDRQWAQAAIPGAGHHGWLLRD